MDNTFKCIKKLRGITKGNSSSGDFYFEEKFDPTLNKAGLNKQAAIRLAHNICTSLSIDENDCEDLEFFADFTAAYIKEYALAVSLYLKALEVAPYRSTVYKKLCKFSCYGIENINKSDLLNKLSSYQNKFPTLHRIAICQSYISLGYLLCHLGRFADAKKAFLRVSNIEGARKQEKTAAQYYADSLDFLTTSISIGKENLQEENKKTKLVIGSIFFGPNHTHLYSEFAGPSFFSRENIECLKKHWDPLIVIFCGIYDKVNFKNSNFYKMIQGIFRIKIYTIPESILANYPLPISTAQDLNRKASSYIFSLAHICLQYLTKELNASLINLLPDAIYPNNCVATINDAKTHGKEMVCTLKLSTIKDLVVSNLQDIRKSVKDAYCFNMDNLLDLCNGTLHPYIEHTNFINDTRAIHAFNLHPIFVGTELIAKSTLKLFDSLDSDYLYGMCPIQSEWDKKIHVAVDKNFLCMVKLQESTTEIRLITKENNEKNNFWISQNIKPINIWMLKHMFNVQAAFKTHDFNPCNSKLKSFISENQNIPVMSARDLKALTLYANRQIYDLKQTSDEKKIIPANDAHTKCKILFAVTVWGRKYVDNFINICLPSMLAEGNLPELTYSNDCTLLVYTRESDKSVIINSPQFKFLDSILRVEFCEIGAEMFSQCKYSVLTRTQYYAIQRSKGFDFICLLYADFVWAKGSMSFCVKKMSQGYDGVVCPVPPIILEGLHDILSERYEQHVQTNHDKFESYKLSISTRELVGWLKENMHPIVSNNNVDNTFSSAGKSYILWEGPHKDFILRCFHVHPAFLRVKTKSRYFYKFFEGTLDEWYLPKIFPSADNLYYICDSDEMAVVSMHCKNFDVPITNNRVTSAEISKWAEYNTAPMQRAIFQQYSIWHQHDIVDSAWKDIRRRSSITAKEVVMRLAMPNNVLRTECRESYILRKKRLKLLSRIDRKNQIIDILRGIVSRCNIPYKYIRFAKKILSIPKKAMRIIINSTKNVTASQT